jgi:hypothetical protein
MPLCVCVCGGGGGGAQACGQLNLKNPSNYDCCTVICVFVVKYVYMSCYWFINMKYLLSVYFHRSKMQYWGSG